MSRIGRDQNDFVVRPCREPATLRPRMMALLSAVVPERLDFGQVVAVLIVVLGLIPFASPFWFVP